MRHDEIHLKRIHDHAPEGVHSHIANLPFFYLEVPDAWLLSPKQVNLEEVAKHLPTDTDIRVPDMLPFQEFSFILGADPCLHVLEMRKRELLVVTDWFCPKNYPQTNEYGLPENPDTLRQVNKGIWTHVHKRQRDGTYDCLVAQHYRHKVLQEMDLAPMQNAYIQKVYERNAMDMAMVMETILALFHTAEERSEHLVRITPAPRGTGSGKPWSPGRYSPKHHYVYLDGPPAHVIPSGEHTGITRRGHARKAYWRRLMHPRYKNHPNYGGRIRVKDTWVGPKEWADQGKIYTLHEPEEL